MITMELTVYRPAQGLGCLEGAAVREDIRCLFREVGAGLDWRPAEGEVSVTFTGDAALAARLAQDRRPFADLVYLGRAEDVLDALPGVSEVWPAEEPDAARLARFTQLAGRMRDRFDSALYRGLLESTLATAPDLVWFKHVDGTHLLVNQVFAETVHKDRADIHGKDHYYIWDAPRPQEGEEVNDCSASEEQVIREERTCVFEEPVSTREGMKQLTTYKTPIYDPLGHIFGTVGFGHDVTHFSNMGIQLSILVESIPFPMLLLSWEGKAMRMNSAFQAIAGLGADDWEGFDYRAWKRRRLTAIAPRQEDPQRHSTSQEYSFEVDGEEKICNVIEVEIRDYFGNISGYFCVLQDITFQRAYEKEILRAANVDTLTGLYSRRYFFEYLSYVQNLPLTLLYVDVDRLKEANDRFGHDAGDEALKSVAAAFTRHFPEGVSARLGGDEFAILIEGKVDPADLEKRCGELEADVDRAAAEKGLPISVSIGTVSSDGDLTDTEAFLKEGDRRMYQVKERHHKRRQEAQEG